MGQMANGILYGCVAPALPDDEYGERWHNLIMRWDKHSAKRHIRLETEGGRNLIGVWVAVGGGGEDDAPYFLDACVPLDEIELVFAQSIKTAEKLWQRFATQIAKKEGIELPAPTLWLTPCETA
jgi:hypothetical protein